MIFLLLLSSVFILFLHLLHFVFPSILPSIPALFPSFLFPFGDCGGQGPTFCRSQQSCCFCLRSRFPANTRCVSHGWQFFPVAHQNSVPFLWNSVWCLFHCMLQARVPSFQVSLYLWVLFSSLYKVSRSTWIFPVACALVQRPKSSPLPTPFYLPVPENYRIHLCYCFSSDVILDVLCSITFCGFSQHF